MKKYPYRPCPRCDKPLAATKATPAGVRYECCNRIYEAKHPCRDADQVVTLHELAHHIMFPLKEKPLGKRIIPNCPKCDNPMELTSLHIASTWYECCDTTIRVMTKGNLVQIIPTPMLPLWYVTKVRNNNLQESKKSS